MNLTPNFTLDELTRSDYAVRHGIDNTPPADVRENLEVLAHGLERVRAILGSPVLVSSGYRCPKLNSALKSKNTSAHLKGLAADFTAPDFGNPAEIMLELVLAKADIGFDQAILEFDRWVHIAFPAEHDIPRLQALSYDGKEYTRIA